MMGLDEGSVAGQGSAAWAGIFPAALTMFSARGKLDEGATRRHMEWLISEGADGLVVGGTSGEFISLTEAERVRLIALAVDAAVGRVPIIAGTGYFSTRETIRLTRIAEAAGAAGAIVILPYYQRPSVNEIVDHYRSIASATGLPIMAYNNPTNANAPALEIEHLAQLHREGVVTAVKSTFPTVHQVHELRAGLDPSFRVFYGSFMAPLEGLAGGAHGWISGILNVVLPQARQLYEAIAASDLAAARAAWASILPIKQLYTLRQLGDASDLAIYRAILDIRGVHGGHSRAPLANLDRERRRVLRGILAKLPPVQVRGADSVPA
jgi:4-hydroxy-tetrahydrodipicolinate synthase